MHIIDDNATVWNDSFLVQGSSFFERLGDRVERSDARQRAFYHEEGEGEKKIECSNIDMRRRTYGRKSRTCARIRSLFFTRLSSRKEIQVPCVS
jgi:hypothetical protein